MWQSTFTADGIKTSFYISSEGEYFIYGNKDNSKTSWTVDYMFTSTTPLVGLWGYETPKINTLGMITYNSTLCKEPIVI